MGADPFIPRSNIRIHLHEGITAIAGLLDEQGLLLTSSTCPVLILNISRHGLCFLSGLRFPVRKGYMLDFQMKISGVAINLRGHVVWRNTRDNQYEYGIVFHPLNRLRAVLVRMLNQELLRQSPQQYKIHALYRALSHKAIQ
ncbi:PilZ domain-containing protein [Paenibacillus sp. JDR-2]|uniref:PilZ domain-containing protein n=1 Tax=Paenibacillus sp. (strain JDR-2) TaxID=324057 RepID=UPI0001664A86|nr:PilZ domain-containing protein [Paenibacillus sp. JDR-2]ACT03606.1 type IV pilus assembly PilZ [Paenibacillus sp. JDR-2]